LEEWSPGAAVATKRYVYGSRIDEPLRYTNITTGVHYWYHDNSIGSIACLTDDAGAVVEQYSYKAFGELDNVLDGSGSPIPAPAVGNPFFFHGRRVDSEEGSGLMYFRHRYY